MNTKDPRFGARRADRMDVESLPRHQAEHLNTRSARGLRATRQLTRAVPTFAGWITFAVVVLLLVVVMSVRDGAPTSAGAIGETIVTALRA